MSYKYKGICRLSRPARRLALHWAILKKKYNLHPSSSALFPFSSPLPLPCKGPVTGLFRLGCCDALV